jgi:PAS domain S-box-containing protein
VIPDIINSPYYEPCRRAMSDGETVDFQAFSEHANAWFSIRAYPSESGLSIYFQDITQRKEIEENGRKAEEYRNLFRLANDPIIIFEPVTEIVLDVNDKACDVYGYPRNDFIGMSLKKISYSGDGEAEQLQELLRYGGSQEFESVQRRADGTPLHLQINSSLIEFKQQQAILSINRDVTARKQTERALHEREEQLRQSQKMEAIGQLAGGVAHDFNNLLTTILLNTQLGLARLNDEPTLRRRLTEIEKSSERAAALTRQLLAFSRRQTLERKSIKLDDTTADIMKMVRRIIGENIEVQVQSAGNLPTVFADPTQIEQVLMNLAINARDAMPDGGFLKIETHSTILDEAYCRLFPYARPGRYVQMRVTDTGSGMDADTRRRIFEPFFTTKEIGKGTGLGLAMVYGIIKQHNGLIEVYSKPGQGTTFEIFLPVEDNPVVILPESVESEIQGGAETILLVEDEESLRKLAGTVLEELGYKVLLAADGIAGVETFTQHVQEIDLVILDVVMPRMSGRDAYERIRALSPTVTIMFTTGYSAEMAHTRFIEDTGSALMQKPYSVDSFARKVRDVLEAKPHR